MIHGFLSTESFHDLLRATAFTVNAAHAEGQCLPLMEYMAAGKPAIAPNHTAMADYITDDSAFPVSSSIELAAWPQDPRQVFRCVRYRISGTRCATPTARRSTWRPTICRATARCRRRPARPSWATAPMP